MHRTILWLLVLTLQGFSQNHLEVIYPKNEQQIRSVDSTFIFGNTNPDAKLTINRHEVDVHKDGGFLAFLPVEKGFFTFNLISDLNGDTSAFKLDILIGSLSERIFNNIHHSSISPSGRTTVLSGGAFDFSLKAKTGGKVYCSLNNDSWTPDSPQMMPAYHNDFGAGLPLASSDTDFTTYMGSLSLDDIVDSSRIYFCYEKDIYDSNGVYLCSEFENDSTDYYVALVDNFPMRVVTLTGRPHIIRIAPWKGYKLVNQQAGIRFLYAGETPDYYRVRLADNSTGYIRKADAVLEPFNATAPEGEVYRIAVDDNPKYVQISMETGDKLPYEIHTDGDIMTVDFYGLNSDTDWIKIKEAQEYIKQIWWTQPLDGVYRLHIRWYDKHFWGYESGYENNAFTLKLKKRLYKKKLFRSPVHGLKIVIDPGHSHDLGAVGPTGLEEKNPNLWIAHELRLILQSKGAEVLMTRMGHEHLGLYDRVDMANEWDADLLISIHNNALPDGVNPFVHNGTSVYYYFNQARPLAEAIHKRLVKATGLPDHGLYYGNLALCRVTECPSVLVECAFMMLPEQEAMLKTDKFQRKCAKAIYKGIVDYLKE